MGSSSSWFAERALALLLLTIAGCGDDDGRAIDDAGDETRIALVDPALAFEGQTLVASLVIDGVASGPSAVSAGPELEILEQTCAASRCGVVLRILDVQPNTGRGVPATIDAMNTSIRVTDDVGIMHVGNLGVLPLDVIDQSDSVLMLSGLRFASSVLLAEGSLLRVDSEAGQLVVFGDATLSGVVDASAAGVTPGGGAAAGGPPGEAGAGLGGAPAGSGAGHRDEGEAGPSDEGGARYGEESVPCAIALEPGLCGGSGGGGAAGEGGGGGGAFALIALGPVLGDLEIDARGGDGVSGGGGGSGGTIALGLADFGGAMRLDVGGGRGDGPGGAGAPGWLRVDGAAAEGAFSGPFFEPAPRIVRDPVVSLIGHAPPGSAIAVRILSTGAAFAAATDDTGTFAVEIALEVGLDRLALESTSDGVTVRSLAGNGLELETLAPGQTRVVGATLDLAYVP